MSTTKTKPRRGRPPGAGAPRKALPQAKNDFEKINLCLGGELALNGLFRDVVFLRARWWTLKQSLVAVCELINCLCNCKLVALNPLVRRGKFVIELVGRIFDLLFEDSNQVRIFGKAIEYSGTNPPVLPLHWAVTVEAITLLLSNDQCSDLERPGRVRLPITQAVFRKRVQERLGNYIIVDRVFRRVIRELRIEFTK